MEPKVDPSELEWLVRDVDYTQMLVDLLVVWVNNNGTTDKDKEVLQAEVHDLVNKDASIARLVACAAIVDMRREQKRAELGMGGSDKGIVN